MAYPINKFVTQIGQKRPHKLLFLSIGNPSPKFDLTRHSAGHVAVDYFAEQLGGFDESSIYWDSSVELNRLKDHPNVYMGKSTTFMNNSGKALVAAQAKLGPQCRYVIVHDDIDSKPGMAKFKLDSRQMGAHGGLNSLSKLGNPFPRIRIGIGEPEGRMHGQVASYVMRKFTPEERDILMNTTIPAAFDYVKSIVEMFEKPIKKKVPKELKEKKIRM